MLISLCFEFFYSQSSGSLNFGGFLVSGAFEKSIQKALANVTSNAYAENQWKFGQAVAVMILDPVLPGVAYL